VHILICTYVAHFETTCQRRLGLITEAKFCTCLTPVKSWEVGKMSISGVQVQLRTQPLIYFWWGSAAYAERFNTLPNTNFEGGYKLTSVLRWRNQTTPNFGRTHNAYRCSHSLSEMSGILLHFRTGVPQNPKLGHFLTY